MECLNHRLNTSCAKLPKSTIWGLPQQMLKSPLASEIEARGERAYRPSGTEKVAGKATGAVIDAVSLGRCRHMEKASPLLWEVTWLLLI